MQYILFVDLQNKKKGLIIVKKIIEIIKSKDIVRLLSILIIVTALCLFVKLSPSDELWNFANSYKMYKGYEIYKDINVIITPLFFYIAQIFFYIFGATMLGFRIYNIFISTTVYILIYMLFKKLNIERKRAFVYLLIIIFLLYSIIPAGANYNIMVLIPILINMILILKKKNSTIISAILLFITFLIKQNIFVYHAIGIIIYEFINRQTIKEFIERIIEIFLICVVFIIIFLFYLYKNNSLYDFINYCFLGITDFGKNNIGYAIIGSRYLYIALIIIAFNIYILTNKKTRDKMDNETISNSKMLLSFGIPMLAMAYPIFNYYHTTLASLILIICFMYLIDRIIIKDIWKKDSKIKVIYILIISIIMSFNIYAIGWVILELNSPNYYFRDNAYFGSYVLEEELIKIKEICTFIEDQNKKGIDVKVLSHKANLYMVQMNKNNGIFDMPFLGNLGIEGEDNLINNIKRMNNTLLLVEREEEKVFGQQSKKVREYVIKNYKKIGEMQEYSIYKIGI